MGTQEPGEMKTKQEREKISWKEGVNMIHTGAIWKKKYLVTLNLAELSLTVLC